LSSQIVVKQLPSAQLVDRWTHIPMEQSSHGLMDPKKSQLHIKLGQC